MAIHIYYTGRPIFKEVDVYSTDMDHYTQRHFSPTLFPKKSKVSQTVGLEKLITETLSYGMPVRFTDGCLELRLHYKHQIGTAGYGDPAHYSVLLLQAFNRRWRLINVYVDCCPFHMKRKRTNCQWRHVDKEIAKAKPDINLCYDLYDHTILWEIKQASHNAKWCYTYEEEFNKVLYQEFGCLTGKLMQQLKKRTSKKRNKKRRPYKKTRTYYKTRNNRYY